MELSPWALNSCSVGYLSWIEYAVSPGCRCLQGTVPLVHGKKMGSLDDLVQYRMARYMAFSVCRGLDRLSWIPKTADNFVNLERH